MVWAVGFEPTTSRFQGEDSDRTELRPVSVGRGRLTFMRILYQRKAPTATETVRAKSSVLTGGGEALVGVGSLPSKQRPGNHAIYVPTQMPCLNSTNSHANMSKNHSRIFMVDYEVLANSP